MNKLILFILTVNLLSHSAVHAAVAEKQMSKAQLCDYAIQALEQLMQKSPQSNSKPAITKEQCMAISDKDIDDAIKKMTETDAGKSGKK